MFWKKIDKLVGFLFLIIGNTCLIAVPLQQKTVSGYAHTKNVPAKKSVISKAPSSDLKKLSEKKLPRPVQRDAKATLLVKKNQINIDNELVALFKEKIQSEEVAFLLKIAEKLKVSPSDWSSTYAWALGVKSAIQRDVLKKPLSHAYRNSKIPHSLVVLVESIAVKYGMHPKSFHIQIPQKNTADMEDELLYDAWIDAPHLFVDQVNKNIALFLRTAPILFIPESFIKRYSQDPQSCLLTLHHELIHLRELNGWILDFILDELVKKGYQASEENPKIKKDIECYFKVMERNTDILALIDDPVLLNKVLEKDQEIIKKMVHDKGTDFHFPNHILIKWRALLGSLQKAKKFGDIEPMFNVLQQTEKRYL